MQRKTELFFQQAPGAGDAGGGATMEIDAPAESTATRHPGVSLYQILKTYEVVGHVLTRRNIDGQIQQGSAEDIALQARSQNITQWCRQLQPRADPFISQELGSQAWNVEMHIEADGVLDALDEYLFSHVEKITQQNPPARFDADAAFDEFPEEPAPPSGSTGMVTIPVVDMQGRVIDAGQPQYSSLAHLTQNQLKLAWVQLPSKATPHLLSRVVPINGVPCRYDWAGGSRAKPDGIKLDSLFAEDDGLPRKARKQGQLLGVPYSDTAPGSAFSKFAHEMMGEDKEAYWYWQRAGLASPPDVPGLKPQDHVLQVKNAKFKAWADRPDDKPHPLVLCDPRSGEQIKWKMHDGAAVIPLSLAECMPLIDKARKAKLKPFGENGGEGNIPASALQHYARNDAVVQERRARLSAELDAEDDSSTQQRDGVRRFRQLTTGRLTGKVGMAGNSSDDTLYLSSSKSAHIQDVNAGVMVFRSPADKPNIRTFPADKVCTDPNHPTVRFLDACMTAQFSFLVRKREADGRSVLQFHKGKAYLVPDEYLLPQDRHIHTSVKNIKTNRSTVTPDEEFHGDTLIQLTDVFMEGSEYLIPVQQQERSDGDVDGDPGTIIGDCPALFAHVSAKERELEVEGWQSLKPPKTHTPSVDEQGRYRFGRGRQVLSSLQGLIESYTGAQMRYLSMSPEVRQEVAEMALFGSFEGTQEQLKRDVREALKNDEADAQQLQGLTERAQQDAQHADHPVAGEVAQMLVLQLQALADGTHGQPVRLSERARSLFPRLDVAWEQAETPRERVLAILDEYPKRMTLPPEAHVHGDAQRSLENFLSLGIKVGTDAFKSNTAVPVFTKQQKRLARIMNEVAPDSRGTDYSKGTARKLNAGTYDHDAVQQRLASNPTLAAQLMDECGSELRKRGKLRLPPRQGQPRPVADLPSAQEIHREAIEREPVVSADVQQVLASLGGTRREPELTVRSQGSLAGELDGGTDSALGNARKVPMALRYALEWPATEFTQRSKQAMAAFNEQGYAVVTVNNAFTMHDPSFAGVSLTLEAPDGYRFGVQLHTPASYDAKRELHDAHKQVQDEHRKQQPNEDRVRALRQTMRERVAQVPLPPDVDGIVTWHEDPEEGMAALRQSRRARPQPAGPVTPARTLAAQAGRKQAQITPAMQEVAQQVQAGLMGNAHLDKGVAVEAPADSRYLKSTDSLKAKIKREAKRDGITPQEAAARVHDALRYVMVWPTAQFSDGVQQVQNALQGQGLQVVRSKNYFTDGDGTYKGINLVLADGEGYQFELQLHTEESHLAKLRNHLSYKKVDKTQTRLDAGVRADKVDALELDVFLTRERMRFIAGSVPNPSGNGAFASST